MIRSKVEISRARRVKRISPRSRGYADGCLKENKKSEQQGLVEAKMVCADIKEKENNCPSALALVVAIEQYFLDVNALFKEMSGAEQGRR